MPTSLLGTTELREEEPAHRDNGQNQTIQRTNPKFRRYGIILNGMRFGEKDELEKIKYEGQLKNEAPHGRGILTTTLPTTPSSKIIHSGEFVEGELGGAGYQRIRQTSEDGDIITYVIEGVFYDILTGCASQMQRFVNDDLSWTYQGMFRNSLRHGQGRCTRHNDGMLFEGDWEDGELNWGRSLELTPEDDEDDAGLPCTYVGEFQDFEPKGVGHAT